MKMRRIKRLWNSYGHRYWYLNRRWIFYLAADAKRQNIQQKCNQAKHLKNKLFSKKLILVLVLFLRVLTPAKPNVIMLYPDVRSPLYPMNDI